MGHGAAGGRQGKAMLPCCTVHRCMPAPQPPLCACGALRLPSPTPLQAPVTAAGAAETAAERHAASQEAQLAAVGEVAEWTVMQHGELAGDGPQPMAVAQPAKKAIAVK